MNRVPYRRVSPSRIGGTSVDNSSPPEPTGVETIVLQSLASGALLVCVLLLGLTNIDAAANLRNTLRHALSGAETPAQLYADLQSFGEEFFGTTQPTQLTQPHETFEFAPSEAPAFPEIPILTLPPALPEPLTATYEGLLHPQIPGPSVVPELRD